MDQETIRLIVSVSGTVAGVLITAWFARKNLGRSLEAAKSTEHETWVRNQKQEAYTNFLAKAETAVHQAYSNFKEPFVQPRLDEMSVARRRIHIVGAPSIIELARKIDWEARKAVVARDDMEEVGEDLNAQLQSMNTLSGIVHEFNNLVGLFIEAVRTELGTGAGVLLSNMPDHRSQAG